MNATPRRSQGFTLVELMVAMVAGLVASYAVVAFAMSSMKSNAEYVQSTKLTQSLRNTMDVVVRDLRRAGYDETAIIRLAGGATNANVGVSPFAPICRTTGGSNTCITNGSVGDCVIYAYDRNGGTGGTLQLANGEVRGLRRKVVTQVGYSTTVGVIEYAVSEGAIRPTCGGASGVYTSYPPSKNTTTLWRPLTDSSLVNVTAFTVTENPNSSAAVGADPVAVRLRNFEVVITARLVGDNGTSYLNGVSGTYSRGVKASVKIRTDCVSSTISNCNASP